MYVRSENKSHVLIVRYEQLVEKPEVTLNRLTAFTGVRGIVPAVLQRRINTFEEAMSRGASIPGYVALAPFAASQRQIIEDVADRLPRDRLPGRKIIGRGRRMERRWDHFFVVAVALPILGRVDWSGCRGLADYRAAGTVPGSRPLIIVALYSSSFSGLDHARRKDFSDAYLPPEAR